MVAQVFHFYAGAVDKHYGETIPVAGGIDVTFREPLGVVGLITPWNFPLNIASWKVGPALATGNTIVIKPAELTPADDAAARRAGARGGHPRRASLNVVVGKGSVVGAAPRRASGRREGRVYGLDRGRPARDAGAAATIKRVTLELGGKLRERRLRRRRSRAGGPRRRRTRSSTTRARIAAPGRGSSSRLRPTTSFVELLVKSTTGVKVGDPTDDATEMGPLISAEHRATVGSFVQGEPLFQGDVPDGPGASGSRAPSSRHRTTIASRARRSSAPVVAVIPVQRRGRPRSGSRTTPRTGLSGSI
jgi:betaine-aldehyde dehydrogenase